jgi:hypothetical protein
MKASAGAKNTPKIYKYAEWLYPVIKAIAPNVASTLAEVGRAMIKAVTKGYEKPILEVKDIITLSKR